jgi:hypothetical protein
MTPLRMSDRLGVQPRRERGYCVNAFTDYETAMRWVLSSEDPLTNAARPNQAVAAGANSDLAKGAF